MSTPVQFRPVYCSVFNKKLITGFGERKGKEEKRKKKENITIGGKSRCKRRQNLTFRHNKLLYLAILVSNKF